MRKAAWWIAPALGLGAMVAPVLVWPPANPYPAPLFPLLRNAQEYLGLAQLALFLVPVLVLYINRFQIEPEERALSALFGPEYAAYKGRVRRWL